MKGVESILDQKILKIGQKLAVLVHFCHYVGDFASEFEGQKCQKTANFGPIFKIFVSKPTFWKVLDRFLGLKMKFEDLKFWPLLVAFAKIRRPGTASKRPPMSLKCFVGPKGTNRQLF